MEERNYIVYKHTSPSNKVYIGITKQDGKMAKDTKTMNILLMLLKNMEKKILNMKYYLII